MKPKLFLTAICTFFLTTSICFAYTATFTPRLSVKGEYTDNIFLTEKEDLEEDDVITTITPGFDAEILGKNNGAKISYEAAYAKYDKYDIYDGWRHRANLSGWSQPTKHTRLGIRDNFLYTEEPNIDENLAEIRTEDPDIPVDSTVRKSRQVYYQNFAVVDLNHQFGKYGSSFGIGYKHWFLEEDDPDLEDKESHSPFAAVTYWFSPQWGFAVDGSYTRGEFDFSDDVDIYFGSVSLLKRFGKHFTGFLRYSHYVVDYAGESEGDTTHNPTIGIEYDIEKDISLIAELGYFYSDFDERESESNVTGNIRLIKLFEHGKLNLAVLGGYDYSFFTTDRLGYNVYYEPSASLTYRLAKHVNSNIRASYRNSDYTDIDREDDIITAGLGLTWQALEWMSIGLNYRYRTVDSTISTEEYDENRVGVGITVYPTVPFHTSRY